MRARLETREARHRHPGNRFHQCGCAGTQSAVCGLFLAKGVKTKRAPACLSVERLLRPGYESSRPQRDHFIADDLPIAFEISRKGVVRAIFKHAQKRKMKCAGGSSLLRERVGTPCWGVRRSACLLGRGQRSALSLPEQNTRSWFPRERMFSSGDVLLSHDLSSYYHRGCSVSLPCSEWERVVPLRWGPQTGTAVDAFRVWRLAPL